MKVSPMPRNTPRLRPSLAKAAPAWSLTAATAPLHSGLLRVTSAFPLSPRLRVSASNGPRARRWPVGSFLAPRTSTAVDTCSLRKLRSLSDLSLPWVFSAFFSALAPRLCVSASNGPRARRWPVGSFLAPRTSTAVDTCSLRKLRSLSDLSLPWVFSAFFSALAPRLRVSASPRRMGPRPPLARRQFPRPINIDSSRYLCSAVRLQSAFSQKTPAIPSLAGMSKIPTKESKMSDYAANLSRYTEVSEGPQV